jgi:hypothetical protein
VILYHAAISLAFIFFVEEGVHRSCEERGFLDERKMPALFKYDEARIRYPFPQ